MTVLGVDCGQGLAAALVRCSNPRPVLLQTWAAMQRKGATQEGYSRAMSSFLCDVFSAIKLHNTNASCWAEEWEVPHVVVAEEVWIAPGYGRSKVKRRDPKLILPVGSAASAVVACEREFNYTAHLVLTIDVCQQTDTRSDEWLSDVMTHLEIDDPAQITQWAGPRKGKHLQEHVASAAMLASYGATRLVPASTSEEDNG